MEVVEVSPKVYGDTFPNVFHAFNSVAFNRLNESKCEQVYYLVFKDSKIRLGIILGIRNAIGLSPFSAPFGGFLAVHEDVKLNQIDASLVVLKDWAIKKNISGLRIIAPPLFYDKNLLNKLHNCLFRAGFESRNIELNYHFPTCKFSEHYQSEIWRNARKNLKRSFQADLKFEKLENENGKKAYDVIALNRQERGFPLRMKWEQVLATTRIIPADFFLIKKEELPIAAAVVFHVASQIVQVIYWGDLPQYAEYKTMNFLSFHVFQYYQQLGIKLIDIGPSTEDSVPNHGLCEFKESIGCQISIKTEFYKSFNVCN